MASVNVRPLHADLPFGARMSGLTRQAVQTQEIRQRIRDVFEDRGVVVFEGVESTAEMQVLISAVIGPLKDHPVKMVRRYDRDNRRDHHRHRPEGRHRRNRRQAPDHLAALASTTPITTS